MTHAVQNEHELTCDHFRCLAEESHTHFWVKRPFKSDRSYVFPNISAQGAARETAERSLL